MPVGNGTVKTESPEESKCSKVAVNTYHLTRPGDEPLVCRWPQCKVREFPVIQPYSWPDMAGFRVYSLADSRNITEENLQETSSPSKFLRCSRQAERLFHPEHLGRCVTLWQPWQRPQSSTSLRLRQEVHWATSRWAERGLKAHSRPHTIKVLGCSGAGLKICVASLLKTWSKSMIFQATYRRTGCWWVSRRDECGAGLHNTLCCLKISLVISWSGELW